MQEEGGGGAHRSQRKNCETSSKAPSPRYVETNQITEASASFLHMVKEKTVTHCVLIFQEKRRAERAEQQRIRAEKDKERQARREVCSL